MVIRASDVQLAARCQRRRCLDQPAPREPAIIRNDDQRDIKCPGLFGQQADRGTRPRIGHIICMECALSHFQRDRVAIQQGDAPGLGLPRQRHSQRTRAAAQQQHARIAGWLDRIRKQLLGGAYAVPIGNTGL